MPPQGRLGDKSNVPVDAHGCPACPHPAVGPAIVGSPDVMVNKRPALRVGDKGIHAACCGPNTWERHGRQRHRDDQQQGRPPPGRSGQALRRHGPADRGLEQRDHRRLRVFTSPAARAAAAPTSAAPAAAAAATGARGARRAQQEPRIGGLAIRLRPRGERGELARRQPGGAGVVEQAGPSSARDRTARARARRARPACARISPRRRARCPSRRLTSASRVAR